MMNKDFPKGWETRKLIDLTTGIFDGTHATPNYTKEGIPFYSVENITKNDFLNTKYISLEEHEILTKRCKPEKGDILMTRIGSIGDTKLIDWDVEASIYVSLALIKPSNEVLTKYLYQYTKSDLFKRELHKHSLQNAVPQKINLGEIGQVRVAYPKETNEQKKIAEILSTWDEAIDIYRNLIEQKRTFLSNLALILVKNKKSLVGFQSKWTKVKLSDVYRERKEYKIPSEEYELYSLTIEDGVTKKTDRYERGFLVKDDKKRYKVTEYNDLVFNPQNLRYGAISLNKTEKPVLLSPIYSMMKIKDESKYDADYFNFLLTSNEMIRYYDSIAEGTLVERMTVKPDVFLNLEFNIPPFEEQLKISKILLAFKNEINVLNEAKELLEKQKQGLMQQLLTGKIRVNLN